MDCALCPLDSSDRDILIVTPPPPPTPPAAVDPDEYLWNKLTGRCCMQLRLDCPFPNAPQNLCKNVGPDTCRECKVSTRPVPPPPGIPLNADVTSPPVSFRTGAAIAPRYTSQLESHLRPPLSFRSGADPPHGIPLSSKAPPPRYPPMSGQPRQLLPYLCQRL